MNNKVKCFDVVDMVVEEANKRFAPIFVPDQSTYDVLGAHCNTIDDIVEEFEGVSIEVEVNEETMQILVIIECEELILSSPSHKFYDVLSVTQGYSFSASDDKNLLIKLIFPSIWNRR